MQFRKTTPKTFVVDLAAFVTLVKAWPAEALDEDLAAWFNRKMDELLVQDAFGTEGQCDPRGDHRD
jgi:hypothetical protein